MDGSTDTTKTTFFVDDLNTRLAGVALEAIQGPLALSKLILGDDDDELSELTETLGVIERIGKPLGPLPEHLKRLWAVRGDAALALHHIENEAMELAAKLEVRRQFGRRPDPSTQTEYKAKMAERNALKAEVAIVNAIYELEERRHFSAVRQGHIIQVNENLEVFSLNPAKLMEHELVSGLREMGLEVEVVRDGDGFGSLFERFFGGNDRRERRKPH